MGTRAGKEAGFRRWFGSHLAEIRHSPEGEVRRILDRGMERWRAHENRFHPPAGRLLPEAGPGRIADALALRGAEPPEAYQAEAEALEAALADALRGVRILPFPMEFAIEPSARRALYVLARTIRPEVILETGVANGVSSWYFLEAIRRNGRGRLVSVDYPVLDAEQRRGIGCLVPSDLRGPWTLILDDSVRAMESLLLDGLSFDMFLHDSEHTYLKMREELDHAWWGVRPGGVLLIDDIHDNSAFEELLERAPEDSRAARCGRMGILRKPPSGATKP